MQPVTVAVADADFDRRMRYEHSLQGAAGVKVLTNVASSNDAVFEPRRAKSRANITITENEVARVKRLKPRVLLVDFNLCSDTGLSMLTSLRQECPETYVVLLIDNDDAINEDMIMQAMETGVRGYLSHETAQRKLQKVAQVVELGEVWAPRKMLGKLLNRVTRHEV